MDMGECVDMDMDVGDVVKGGAEEIVGETGWGGGGGVGSGTGTVLQYLLINIPNSI